MLSKQRPARLLARLARTFGDLYAFAALTGLCGRRRVYNHVRALTGVPVIVVPPTSPVIFVANLAIVIGCFVLTVSVAPLAMSASLIRA